MLADNPLCRPPTRSIFMAIINVTIIASWEHLASCPLPTTSFLCAPLIIISSNIRDCLSTATRNNDILTTTIMVIAIQSCVDRAKAQCHKHHYAGEEERIGAFVDSEEFHDNDVDTGGRIQGVVPIVV
eukprot:139504_1